MKELLPAWILALLLVGATPAWAAPGVVSLTTPVLPANAARTPINNLTASTGTPTRYSITVLPGGGTLYVNGVAIAAAPRNLTPTEATQLSFQPSGTTGNYSFTFTATDGTGTSAAATYTLSVGLATCGQGTGLDFSTRTLNETWQAQAATVGSVTTTSSGYAGGDGTNRFQIERLQGGSQSAALTWFADYATKPNSTSQVTFTFSRPVSGFSLVVQDIDATSNNLTTATFIDQVQFDGYASGSSTPIALTNSNVKLGGTSMFSGNNCVTGTNISAANPADNVIVTFPQAITKLTLTYRNTQTAATDPAQQAIGIPSFGWCAEADIATTITGPARAQASSAVTYSMTTKNNGPDLPTSLTPTLQLPTGLAGVTVNSGGTYNSTTGLVSFSTIAAPALNTVVSNNVTFTMPASNAVPGTAAYQSPILDNTPANNAATLATTQNRAPVASDVTSSPAILSSTTSQTNIAPFNASDPDASTGNTTIVSYTIVSLPTAAQGTLYVGGTAATAGQVIAVPTTATPGNPGYQLSFVPNGSFSGNATFTYRATDDVGSVSNTANYAVPVTAGADLVSTVGGQPVGVEGQSKSYSVTTTNNGPATSTNAVPTLTLSSKPGFSSVTVNNGSYDATTGIITFNATPSLASGATVVNSFSLVVPPTPSSFTLTAASTSATADPTPANNNGTAAAAILTVAVSPIGPAGVASACATPGADGSPTITTGPNTYYPASLAQTVAVGATSLSLDAAVGATPIAIGDLLLVIQMQGADIDHSNTDSYGDGVAGGLASSNLSNANFVAGQYEYVVAATALPLGGGALTLTTGLKKSYQHANATSTTGQRRFQVVRIPQYKNLTISGTVAPSAWNGSTGGILALDVTGQLAFASGAKIDASGLGFRGGAGQRLLGTTGLTGTDYRAAAPASATTTTGAHAMKGEGIVGTPRYVNSGTALLDTGTDGYPSGSAGRGAPGNAGGGGDTSSPADNTQNSGGGGGGNGARGGRGGNAWQSSAVIGGELGSSFSSPSTSRLILGGGGGAGVSNDGTGTGPTLGYASSGAAGGGIVLVRTGSVAGFGTILANGASANNTVQNDGSGGGGAGGAILVTANNTTSLGSLTLAANGGSGGTNTGANINGSEPHGPGGGGGGGIVLTNAAPSSASVAGGANGTTDTGSFGAAAGAPGIANGQVSNSIAGSASGINCSTDVVTVILAPSAATAGQTASLSVSFTNNGGVAATTVTRTVTLASGDVLNPVTSVSAPGSSSISAPDPSTGTVTITYPGVSPLAGGSSASFGISYVAPGTSSVVATSTITTTTAEPVTTNNTSSATTAINGYADVVSAVFGLSSSTTGQATATYAAVFANNGPAAAAGVTRTVTLPAGATLTSAQLQVITSQGGSYNAGTQGIDFGTVATLASKAASVFQFGYTASNTSGVAYVTSNIATSTTQDASNGQGAAPDQFAFAVTNNAASDLATNGVTVSAATVTPGQTASFTLNFVNYGPADAASALRYAQLTPGLSGVSVTNNGVYDSATGIITYPSIAMANGATAPSTVTFTAPAVGPVNVSGSLSGGGGSASSGIFGNNQATGSIAVTPVADVATTLSGPTTSVLGNLVTYAITTANNGPSAAAAVVQTVQLPKNLNGVFASNNGSYNASSGVVTFPALAVLPTGTVANNTVSFAMPSAAFAASAAVTTTTTEASGTTANNAAPAPTTSSTAATTDQANVYNTLAINNRHAAPGAAITFTIMTGNSGPNTALNVAQQLSLPPGLNTSSISITNSGTYDPASGVVTFPTLASQLSGASTTNTVVVTAPTTGPVVAMASVSATTSDPVPGDNVMSRNVNILSAADVLTTLVGPGVAASAQVPTFTVTTSNKGPVPAINVVQTVAIPADFAPTDVTVSNGGAYDPATGLITWPTVATLGVEEVKTYSYLAPATPSTDASASHTIMSRASVTSASPDAVSTNNSVAVGTDIKWNADVAIAVAGPATAILGNSVTFTVSTINNGPSPAGSVAVTVRIATGLSNVVASGGVYSAATGLVTFPTIASQVAGATGSVTNTITLLVPDRPLIGVSAAANNAANDINLTNNAATLVIPVSPRTSGQADLQTTIAANVSSQLAGQPIVLTATATNAGPSASALRERVTLPAGLSSVSVLDANGSALPTAYDPASGVVTFPITTSQPSGTTLTYRITVNNPGNDPLVATASVNGNLSDPTPANNTQTVSVTIVPVADVATRLTGPGTALPGSLTTYQVVTRNNGPSPASAVVQTVQLPTGLSTVAVSGGGSYDATSGLVTFPRITTQAVGKFGEVTNSISFPFPVTAASLTATVASGTNENGATANNTSALTTTLANQLPIANTRTNTLQAPEGNTASPLPIAALLGYDADGSLASYTIATLPTTGTLALSGTAVQVGQVISNADAANLTFDPVASFVGNAFFTYSTTDNLGAVSAPALYTIAVGQDNASLYTAKPAKGGANPYQNGDVLANVFDANGGTYNAAAVTDNGVRSARSTDNSLPAGTQLDPTTGQITVVDRTLLATGSYAVNVTTIDALGGITTQTVPLQIGAYPLPVDLTRFDAQATGLDGELSWATAQERRNAGFQVERSFDGTTFAALTFVAGAGTSGQAHTYSFLDAGVGQQHRTVYYRLQQRDLDGKTSYSPVRVVSFGPPALAASVGLHPNPTTDHTTLDLTALPAGTYQVRVLDLAGRLLQSHTLAGGLTHQLTVGELPSGSYLVVVSSDTLKISRRLSKY